jgi:hypothetical protein
MSEPTAAAAATTAFEDVEKMPTPDELDAAARVYMYQPIVSLLRAMAQLTPLIPQKEHPALAQVWADLNAQVRTCQRVLQETRRENAPGRPPGRSCRATKATLRMETVAGNVLGSYLDSLRDVPADELRAVATTMADDAVDHFFPAFHEHFLERHTTYSQAQTADGVTVAVTGYGARPKDEAKRGARRGLNFGATVPNVGGCGCYLTGQYTRNSRYSGLGMHLDTTSVEQHAASGIPFGAIFAVIEKILEVTPPQIQNLRLMAAVTAAYYDMVLASVDVLDRWIEAEPGAAEAPSSRKALVRLAAVKGGDLNDPTTLVADPATKPLVTQGGYTPLDMASLLFDRSREYSGELYATKGGVDPTELLGLAGADLKDPEAMKGMIGNLAGSGAVQELMKGGEGGLTEKLKGLLGFLGR